MSVAEKKTVRYLIYCQDRDNPNGTVGRWVDLPEGASSEEYGRLQEEFVKEYGLDPVVSGVRYANMASFAWWQRCKGMWYTDELAGPDGCSIMLYPLPGQDDALVEQVIAELLRQHDVVYTHVIRIDRMLDEVTA